MELFGAICNPLGIAKLNTCYTERRKSGKEGAVTLGGGRGGVEPKQSDRKKEFSLPI
jgi:hypothetical protein